MDVFGACARREAQAAIFFAGPSWECMGCASIGTDPRSAANEPTGMQREEDLLANGQLIKHLQELSRVTGSTSGAVTCILGRRVIDSVLQSRPCDLFGSSLFASPFLVGLRQGDHLFFFQVLWASGGSKPRPLHVRREAAALLPSGATKWFSMSPWRRRPRGLSSCPFSPLVKHRCPFYS